MSTTKEQAVIDLELIAKAKELGIMSDEDAKIAAMGILESSRESGRRGARTRRAYVTAREIGDVLKIQPDTVQRRLMAAGLIEIPSFGLPFSITRKGRNFCVYGFNRGAEVVLYNFKRVKPFLKSKTEI